MVDDDDDDDADFYPCNKSHEFASGRADLRETKILQFLNAAVLGFIFGCPISEMFHFGWVYQASSSLPSLRPGLTCQ